MSVFALTPHPRLLPPSARKRAVDPRLRRALASAGPRHSRLRLAQPHRIGWVSLAALLLLVFAACGQSQAAPVTTPTPDGLTYQVTFTPATTWTQAHALLKQVGLHTFEWDCVPRAARAGEGRSVPQVPITTLPPSQDTPEYFAQSHMLIVVGSGAGDPLTPDQLAQLRASPLVRSAQAITLGACS